MGWILAICGASGSGKSTLSLYPHPSLGRVHHIVTEAMSSQLHLPAAWLGDRVTTEQPGLDPKGARLRGADYYKAMVSHAREPKKADTIILNSGTGVAKLRYLDALHILGGTPTKYRTENESAQQLAVHFLKELGDANKKANIIIFYHLKDMMKEIPNPEGKGSIRVLDTKWPETVGRKLDHALGADFDAVLMMSEQDGGMEIVKKGEPPIRKKKYILDFGATPEARFVFTRVLPGEPPPEPMNVTITTPGEYVPLHKAWDVILKHVKL